MGASILPHMRLVARPRLLGHLNLKFSATAAVCH